MRRPVIGVMGGHQATTEVEDTAQALGAAIANEDWILLTGGRDQGVMAAATRGANQAGGLTVGVHPGRREDGDQADAQVIIFTGIGFARNGINVLSSDVLIALPGAAGTLSEIAYAKTYGTPTILLGFDDKGWFGDRVTRVSTVAAAMDAAKAFLARSP